MSGLIVRSWADQEVLQFALRSGIPCLILDAVHGSALQKKISFMANPNFGARLADVWMAIDHKNAAGRIGPASSFCANWLCALRDSSNLHFVRINRTTKPALGGD